jgi:hypothetical protein
MEEPRMKHAVPNARKAGTVLGLRQWASNGIEDGCSRVIADGWFPDPRLAQ